MPISDFDFLIGRWTIRSRALCASPRNGRNWCEFEALYDCRRIGQLGNVAYFRASCPDFPMEGVSIRLYNPERDQWTMSWADTERAGVMQPPVVGHFTGGRGVFYGKALRDGRPVRVRLLWLKAATPHFEQAYSSDDGRTWETNWRMTLEAKKQTEAQMPLRASG